MAAQLKLPLHRIFRVPMHTYTPTTQEIFEAAMVVFSDCSPTDISDLADTQDPPMFGFSDSPSHSIYSYVNWFYDGDESAFSVI